MIDNFTMFDIAALIVMILSCALAYARGIVREAVSILVWIASAIAAYLGAPLAVPLMADLPLAGEFLADSCELSVVAAFTVLFVLSLIILAPLAGILVRLVKFPGLGLLDRCAGILFGALRGAILIAATLLLLDAVLPREGQIEAIAGSQATILFGDLKILIGDLIRESVPKWANDSFANVMAVCGGGGEDVLIDDQMLDDL